MGLILVTISLIPVTDNTFISTGLVVYIVSKKIHYILYIKSVLIYKSS